MIGVTAVVHVVNSLGASARRLAERVFSSMHAHPRRTAAGVAVILLGSGVTAFGVAPLTVVDETPVQTQVISEVVTPQGLQTQLDALELAALSLFTSDRLRSGDTPESLLARLGVSDAEAAQFLRRDSVAQQVFQGRAGKQVRATLMRGPDGTAQLASLVVRGPLKSDARRDDDASASSAAERQFQRITIQRDGQALSARIEQVPLQTQVRLASGVIESSLFAAADDAQLPDAVTAQLAEIFGSDIDFRRELRRGDHFAVLYEALTADGEPVNWTSNAGRVMAARFVNKGESHEAYWFEEPGKRGGYYSADGRSKNRMFLGSPLAFSRVTSGFSMRLHPILQTWRAHLGVDYAAPSGTPVRAVGDASVEFAGWQNGYGNVVQLRHAGDKMTVYAHLSRIDVRRGQRVAQGQLVGAVGSTGWATGPHLHFEFKVAGHQVDPLKVARTSESVALSPAARAQFEMGQRASALALTSAEPSQTAVAVARME